MRLDNPKHERFCRQYVKLLNQTQAYKAVYGDKKGADANASKLIGNAKVAKRIKELQEQAGERVAISTDNVLKFAEKVREMAIEQDKPDFNSALKANDQIARIIGAYNDSLTVKNKTIEDIIKEGELNAKRSN